MADASERTNPGSGPDRGDAGNRLGLALSGVLGLAVGLYSLVAGVVCARVFVVGSSAGMPVWAPVVVALFPLAWLVPLYVLARQTAKWHLHRNCVLTVAGAVAVLAAVYVGTDITILMRSVPIVLVTSFWVFGGAGS